MTHIFSFCARNFATIKLLAEFLSCIGDKITCAFYGVAPQLAKGLNRLRYDKFREKAITNTLDLCRLPPTTATNKQHCLRVYYKIKQWVNPVNSFDVEQYGWRKTINGLLLVTTLDKFLPNTITKKITCKCVKGCSARCSCLKNGQPCTEACKNCEGKNCSNGVPLTDFTKETDDVDLVENEIEKITKDQDSDSEQSEIEEPDVHNDYDNPAYALVYDDTDAEFNRSDPNIEQSYSKPKRTRKK